MDALLLVLGGICALVVYIASIIWEDVQGVVRKERDWGVLDGTSI